MNNFIDCTQCFQLIAKDVISGRVCGSQLKGCGYQRELCCTQKYFLHPKVDPQSWILSMWSSGVVRALMDWNTMSGNFVCFGFWRHEFPYRNNEIFIGSGDASRLPRKPPTRITGSHSRMNSTLMNSPALFPPYLRTASSRSPMFKDWMINWEPAQRIHLREMQILVSVLMESFSCNVIIFLSPTHKALMSPTLISGLLCSLMYLIMKSGLLWHVILSNGLNLFL